MSRLASGHRETQRNIPDPLQRGGWISLIGTLAPPAVTLSTASLLVCAIVFGFLQRNPELRAIFSLQAMFGETTGEGQGWQRLAVLGAGLATACLAWLIVLRCQRRPGPIAPRLWALFLAGLTSAWAVLQCLSPWPNNAPWLDAATVASFAATLTLLPRLLRFHPDSAWLQRIAPLSLLLVLLAVLPAMDYLGGDMVQVRKRGLGGVISGLQEQADTLRRCAESRQGCAEKTYETAGGKLADVVNNPFWHNLADTLQQRDSLTKIEHIVFDNLATGLADGLANKLCGSAQNWPDDTPNQAQQRLAQLSSLHVGTFKALLPVAEKLGTLETTNTAYRKMLDVVVNALPQNPSSEARQSPLCASDKPHQTPSLKMQTVVYIPKSDGPWQPQPHFPEASQAIIGYYQQIDRLFYELGNVLEDGTLSLEALQTNYQLHKEEWDGRLDAMKKSWAYYWLTGFIDRTALHGKLSIDQPTSAIEIPLSEAQAPVLEPALREVMDMPVIGTMKLSDMDSLFDTTAQDLEKFAKDAQLSNCEYKKSDPVDELVSLLRCRAYARGKTPAETRLKLELRMVYRVGELRGKPRQLVLIMPTPSGQTMPGFILEVQSAMPKTRRVLQQLMDVGNAQGSGLTDVGEQALFDGDYSIHAVVHLFSEAPGLAREYLMIRLVKYQ